MPWRPKSTAPTKNQRSRRLPRARQEPPPSTRRQAGKKKAAGKSKLSRLHRPEQMSLEDWQRELRRQFGREQKYMLRNLGEQPVFSEFAVTNPESKRTYHVQIRGLAPGDNHCTCPDFATNTLGTCKHIEFTLARLERKKGGRQQLQAGYLPPYSEVFLHYGARREVRFRPGACCSVELSRLAAGYFGGDGVLLPEAFALFDTFLTETGKLEDELRCPEDVLSFIAEVRDAQVRQRRVSEAFPRGIRSPLVRELVKIELYDY